MIEAPRAQIRSLAPRPMAAARLLMIPYAGAGVSVLRPLAALLPASIEPLGLQLPGREDLARLPFFAGWSAMIDDAANAVSRLPRGPLAIYGHSFGALIGLDVTRRLSAGGAVRTSRLFVGARPAPSLEPPDRDLIEEGLSLDGAALMERMSKTYGTPPASFENPEIRDYALPILKSDLALLKSYAYPGAAGLTVAVTAMVGARDPVARSKDAAAWRRETSGAFEIVEFDAGHYFIDSAREAVAAAISTRLL